MYVPYYLVAGLTFGCHEANSDVWQNLIIEWTSPTWISATPSCRISKPMTEIYYPVSKLLGIPEEYKIFGKVYIQVLEWRRMQL